ncbi:MAG: radical SAM protein [Candidatus Krumholzibacteriota bacterium]|nr:radical SAM protein [Candidatus Krumholzibacteriota bacterium]
MSNLGLHFIYRALASRGTMNVERFFSDSVPGTYETGADISQAEALLFTISYEEDYLELIRMLSSSGIEPLRTKRKEGPLIIAGGPAISANPLPLSNIVDAAALGEGELIIEDLAGILENPRNESRSSRIDKMGAIDGIYIPSIPEKVPVIMRGSPASLFPYSSILSSGAVFPDTLLIETGRGCTGNCGFCLARVLYSPYRATPVESIGALLEKTAGRVEKIGLVSTAVTSHPDFGKIIEMILRYRLKAGFSSLKAEDLDREKVMMIASTGVRSASLAPESGSEQARFRLGKKVGDDVYINAVKELASNGITNINLYMLTGYPGEDGTLFDETRRFLTRIRDVSGRSRITLHTNLVVPKPWTPFQFYPIPSERELGRRFAAISGICRETGIVSQSKSIRSSLRQAVLSIGGVDVGEALIRYSRGRISWKKALSENRIDPEGIHRERGIERPLPWEELTGEGTNEKLVRRYRGIAAEGKR